MRLLLATLVAVAGLSWPAEAEAATVVTPNAYTCITVGPFAFLGLPPIGPYTVCVPTP